MVIGTEDDRRIFARFAVDFPAEFTLPGEQKGSSAECCDISAAGVGLVVDYRIAPEMHLKLKLFVDKQSIYDGLAKVIWSKQVHEGKWRAGLELANIDFMGLSKIFSKSQPKT
ncbi:MAG: PilZ domain-containing protein [Candidatus Omnitrophica bacterium]|nr:PilZ domain-containing protein [Candidatus Omnitrophota bacterium]